MPKKYPIIYIAKPKLKFNFNCMFCSTKYKTTNIVVVHKCSECGKQNTIRSDSYSLDAISYYLTIAISNLLHHDGVILRATDSYILLIDSLVASLTALGLRVIKKEKVEDINKRTKKEIIVNEVVLEKIGAIK